MSRHDRLFYRVHGGVLFRYMLRLHKRASWLLLPRTYNKTLANNHPHHQHRWQFQTYLLAGVLDLERAWEPDLMGQKWNAFNHSDTTDDGNSCAFINPRYSEQKNKISPAPASGIGWRTTTAPETEHKLISWAIIQLQMKIKAATKQEAIGSIQVWWFGQPQPWPNPFRPTIKWAWPEHILYFDMT